MSDKEYTNVLLEDINAKFDAICEIVRPLMVLPAQIRDLTDELKETNARLDVTMQVVKDHSLTLHSHERRITNLESPRFLTWLFHF